MLVDAEGRNLGVFANAQVQQRHFDHMLRKNASTAVVGHAISVERSQLCAHLRCAETGQLGRALSHHQRQKRQYRC